MIYNHTAFIYTFNSAVWSKGTFYADLNPKPNMPMVTDPTTNQVYIPNGYIHPTTGATYTMRYDPGEGLMVPMESSSRLDIDGGYATLWSTEDNKMLTYGGFIRGQNGSSPTYPQTLYEFIPTNPIFTKAAGVSGTPPSARYGHCMIEAYNGTRVLLYGGVDQNNAPLSDLYILNLETMAWTKQDVALPPLGRAYPACAVTNDMFVAWGGGQWDPASNGFKVITSEFTIVFNLKTEQWQTSFSPDPVVLPSTSASTPTTTLLPSTTPKPTGLSMGAVAGGAVGGLTLALAGAGGLFWFCRRRKTTKRVPLPLEKQSLTKGPTGGSVSDDALWSRHSRGDHDLEDNDYDGGDMEGEITPKSGYGFRIGKHQFVQLESGNVSEIGSIYKMVQIHSPTDSNLGRSSQDQQGSLLSTTVIRSPPTSASIVTAATAGSISSTTMRSATASSPSTDSGFSAVAGKKDDERGVRRNPQEFKKVGNIDKLDLSEFENMVVPPRHPQGGPFVEE
ncbi:Acyl-CoA-binding domain-containing protein 5 [Mortierella sp. GBA35]|nr:Acyl-CoA-binding domain-containing protein 5 [Mortierella sp. GBA35]